MKQSTLFLFICGVLLFCACMDPEPESSITVEGLKPIYLESGNSIIESLGPQPFISLGKIVYVDPYIYINERYKGIHVIDNSDPSNPNTIAFLNIPGNLEFTISNNYLYADNGKDLITIDISDVFNVSVISIAENIYNQLLSDQLFPQNWEGQFECVDTTQGVVIGWEEALLENPKCWR